MSIPSETHLVQLQVLDAHASTPEKPNRFDVYPGEDRRISCSNHHRHIAEIHELRHIPVTGRERRGEFSWRRNRRVLHRCGRQSPLHPTADRTSVPEWRAHRLDGEDAGDEIRADVGNEPPDRTSGGVGQKDRPSNLVEQLGTASLTIEVVPHPVAGRRPHRGHDCDRVREVCADFDASAAAGTIADICELLDGIPAAIEAAAAGYRAMSLETILAALRDGRVASPLEAVLGDHLAAVATDLAAATATRRRAWALAVGYQGYVTTSCFKPAEDDRAADPVTAFIDLVDDHGLLREAASGPGFSAFKVPTPYRRMLGVVDVLDEDDVGSAARMKEAHLRGLLEALAAGWFGPDHSSLLTHVNLHRADIEVMLAEMAASPAKAAALIELVTSLRYFWRVGEGELWRHAIAVLLEALPQVPETESAYVRGLSFLSYLRLFEADYESAREASDRSLELASERGDETSMRYALITRALLDLQDPQEIVSAERLVRSSVEASSGQLGQLGEQYNLLATILYVRGELGAAEEVCRVSLHDSETMGDTWGAAYTSLALARVLRARGESEACCDLVREAFVVFDRVNDASGMRRALRLLAGVVMDLGDLERSAVLVGATRQFPAVSSPFGFVDAENLEKALSTRIGRQTLGFRMAAGAELTRTQLRSIVRGGELPRDSSLSVLTSREEEIAELVAAGHSNGQIAQQLVVSRRTVEGHVQRILAKLDFHSRSQIAVWYTEQRRIARGSLIAINSGDSARPTRRALVSH